MNRIALMDDHIALIVAECRAGELFEMLVSALNGTPHWRMHAAELVRAIEDHKLPEYATQALRQVDARKRAAEILDDISRVPSAQILNDPYND